MQGEDKKEEVLYKTRIDSLCKKVKDILGEGSLDYSNCLDICISLMQIVGGWPDLEGKDKKGMIIETFTRIIAEAGDGVQFLSFLIPFIDISISIDNRTIVINPQITGVIGKIASKLSCCK